MKKIELIPITGIPIIKSGDNVVDTILKSLKRKKINIRNDDLMVIAHKIISISENRLVNFNSVKVTQKAVSLSKKTGKSAKFCQLIIENSNKIVKYKRGLIITENNLGIITANAGIDESNIDSKNSALLLPLNPNKSAKMISEDIYKNLKKNIGVIISDSIGRPWRHGLTQISIGSYGVKSLRKYDKDIYGKPLHDTDVPVVDEVASAAGLLMEKDLGVPVVLIRGYNYQKSKRGSNVLLRSDKNDIFK